MPLTPLFPADEEPITMKQGRTRDCYLLASLDCFLNTGTKGRAKVKSLFTEQENGDVVLRIKRSPMTENLQVAKLKKKYLYAYDSTRDEDVITISKTALMRIERTKDGVETNALAVKILEHISSYYFTGDWDSSAPLASVVAHGVADSHSTSSAQFMAHLLGIKVDEVNDIDKLIAFKSIHPDYPIYISMSYGKEDEHGEYHYRHSFRLDKVVSKTGNPKEYEFILVNPWNNQKKEAYSLADIRKRNYRFFLFDYHTEKLQPSVYTFQSRVRIRTRLETSVDTLDADRLKKIISDVRAFLRENPTAHLALDPEKLILESILNRVLQKKDLSSSERERERNKMEETLLNYYFSVEGCSIIPDPTLRWLFANDICSKSCIRDVVAPQNWISMLTKQVFIESAKSVIEALLKDIDGYSFSFSENNSLEDIDKNRKNYLLKLEQLEKNRQSKIDEAYQRLGPKEPDNRIALAINKQKQAIEEAAQARSNRIKKINALLKPIDKALENLQTKIGKIDQHRSIRAYEKAQDLLKTLRANRKRYFEDLCSPPLLLTDTSLDIQFFQTCSTDIHEAKPILSEDLNWGPYLNNLLQLIMNRIVRHALGYRGRLFKLNLNQSESMDNVDEFLEAVKQSDPQQNQ